MEEAEEEVEGESRLCSICLRGLFQERGMLSIKGLKGVNSFKRKVNIPGIT